MDNETIVAVYDTPAHAQLAVADLQQAGVPADLISQHAGGDLAADAAAGPARAAHESGFWSSLFGGEPDTDAGVYSRSVQGGSAVVTVRAAEAQIAAIMRVLESHNPIDIDERASSWGLANNSPTIRAAAANANANAAAAWPSTPLGAGAALAQNDAAEGGRMELAEERLTIGKRLVNRGGTRIRRYVVETPVEQQVRLREERVTLERRPITDDRPAEAGAFSEKIIEMTGTAEEVVVGKTTHVVEEVALRKQAGERLETVQDSVRRHEIDIEEDLPVNAIPRV